MPGHSGQSGRSLQAGQIQQASHSARLCAAIVDRLTFAGQIIETGTTSYRLAHARATKKT